MSVAETNYESRAVMSSCTVSAWINKSLRTTTNQTHHGVSNHSQKTLERQEKSLTQQKWELLTNPNLLGLQMKPKQVKDKRGCLGTEAGGWLSDVSLFQEVKSVGDPVKAPHVSLTSFSAIGEAATVTANRLLAKSPSTPSPGVINIPSN